MSLPRTTEIDISNSNSNTNHNTFSSYLRISPEDRCYQGELHPLPRSTFEEVGVPRNDEQVKILAHIFYTSVYDLRPFFSDVLRFVRAVFFMRFFPYFVAMWRNMYSHAYSKPEIPYWRRCIGNSLERLIRLSPDCLLFCSSYRTVCCLDYKCISWNVNNTFEM